MALGTYTGISNEEGRVINQNTVWSTCHDAASGIAHDFAGASTYAESDLETSGGNYEIDRLFLSFDTSTIGAGAILNSGTLNLFIVSYTDSGAAGTIGISAASPAGGGTVVNSDYGSVTAIRMSTDVAISSLTPPVAVPFILNSNGLNQIAVTGTTRMCIRYATDINNTAPPLGTNFSLWALTANGTVADRPNLVLNYTASGGGGGIGPGFKSLLGVGQA